MRRLRQSSISSLRVLVAAICLMACAGLPTIQAQQLQGLGESIRTAVAVGGEIVGLNADGAIVRTADGGATFEELREPTPSDELLALAAAGDVVVAGGSTGLLLRADFSVDATVWTEVAGGSMLGSVRGIAQDGTSNWIAVGDHGFGGAVLRSTNNASTWSAVGTPPNSALYAVAWNAATGEWIAVGGDGFDGAVYRSTDGLSWTSVDVPFGTPNLLAVAVDAEGNILATGEMGAMLLSTDGGSTFDAPAGEAVWEDLGAVVSVGPNQWIVAGFDGVVISIVDGTGSILLEPDPLAPAIQSLVLVDGTILLSGGAFLAPPVISPGAGSFEEPVAVTLSAEGGAVIHYTLDGTTPTTDSAVYAEPLSITETTTVKAVVIAGGLSSSVASAHFVIAASDPPPEPLRLKVVLISGNLFRVELSGSVVGSFYQLQTSANLVSWTSLQAPREGVGPGELVVWEVSTSDAKSFFRVVTVEAPQPLETLRLGIERRSSSELRLTLTGVTEGRLYQLETSTDLQFWSDLGVAQQTTAAEIIWDVPNDGPARFYRVTASSPQP